MGLCWEANLRAIAKQANDAGVRLDRLREAERVAGESLAAGAYRPLLPFTRLRVPVPSSMSYERQRPSLRAPLLGEEPPDPKGLQSGFASQEDCILVATKPIRQDLP